MITEEKPDQIDKHQETSPITTEGLVSVGLAVAGTLTLIVSTEMAVPVGMAIGLGGVIIGAGAKFHDTYLRPK